MPDWTGRAEFLATLAVKKVSCQKKFPEPFEILLQEMWSVQCYSSVEALMKFILQILKASFPYYELTNFDKTLTVFTNNKSLTCFQISLINWLGK